MRFPKRFQDFLQTFLFSGYLMAYEVSNFYLRQLKIKDLNKENLG